MFVEIINPNSEVISNHGDCLSKLKKETQNGLEKYSYKGAVIED